MTPSKPRVVLLASGVTVLALLWLGPLREMAHHSFAAHMTIHMTVVAVAAPLLAFGLAASRFDPGLPTYVIWEGNTMYLRLDNIRFVLAQLNSEWMLQ